MKVKIEKIMKAVIAVTAVICFTATVQSFVTNAPIPTAELSTSSNKKFVKTKNKCSKCSCSGYWGYKHANGTYEGNCSNSDRYGHTCKHGPEKHGLRKW